jgi:hypothetical protein
MEQRFKLLLSLPRDLQRHKRLQNPLKFGTRAPDAFNNSTNTTVIQSKEINDSTGF